MLQPVSFPCRGDLLVQQIRLLSHRQNKRSDTRPAHLSGLAAKSIVRTQVDVTGASINHSNSLVSSQAVDIYVRRVKGIHDDGYSLNMNARSMWPLSLPVRGIVGIRTTIPCGADRNERYRTEAAPRTARAAAQRSGTESVKS